MRLPRTTGALSGLIVIVLGVWGALIPFIGPYFHYAFGNYDKWHFTTNRLWLDVVPGVVAVIGGWMLFTGSRRKSGVVGGWLPPGGLLMFKPSTVRRDSTPRPPCTGKIAKTGPVFTSVIFACKPGTAVRT